MDLGQFDDMASELFEGESNECTDATPLTETELAALETPTRIWSAEYETVQDRFPGVDGLVLWMLVLKHYVINENALLWFFHEGIPLLFRSLHNDRDERQTRLDYVKKIIKLGFHQHARSRVVTIPPRDPGSHPPGYRFVLAAGHCIEAVYDAWEECGTTNMQVKRSVPQMNSFLIGSPHMYNFCLVPRRLIIELALDGLR